ncbi:DarT ssDNA thymidine ADP-ribosyltransferase family protein [Xanthomonas campestris pv. raphani]|uniref:DarT ssDNA thymidine ADP-ribosyltransferase family protein n=1 Tax=Xanthomonas campestris TaxID=339 RepID=UPI002B239CB3|nr:DarT ssDNA thymidine ADP-ribosyltransferase family protein [Xanthomonas campestris]MEA9773461.1 DarT ssDNA thymidine ADP-ribosyltransferase family protein [Xanthomonas campestris pv. raphani]MEA9801664.1 DarT ssDNA thymidine ADP-ribosyltransferase family protein [Xanthomonas campestris pv. raphani]MEA9833585.1 DarT ssDNA thymidine ADP-ribosyltransferase family protein [Xanthomonas campestris pv. raphani]MEA9951110.1 DarT ssDNA thymidine ADP-ribosyltransferase family protein [Xanthomonas camp
MPTRFAFRQIDRRDLSTILVDKEIRSKNHPSAQSCHQTSYAQIVGFRGTPAYALPYGGVVNDYVQFYFSPVTAFSYVIHRGNVEVKNPAGVRLGMSSISDRVFLVTKVESIYARRLKVCFSDYALNSMAPMPVVVSEMNRLENHVKWPLFDEIPLVAKIPEIGYDGVCQYFKDCPVPVSRQNRKSARMAELLVKNALPLELVECIVTPNDSVYEEVSVLAKTHGFQGVVLNKPGFFV